ncbi:hypothetical protein [Dolichospermum circinale]|uniref:GNAT family N-acetyltransferase n=1 Tax=Dolichospermum circinale CS-537/01 TaxID=3021739 RepID=A0ABT5A8H6_9CYAN|nr:hypothetical protein [Dolichospermum circinale]MDB9473260.1 hypothetical protein [Dolichospermum circinale CS-537/11]MDB9480741.1 hypothetical protein [Dolichospermum circinale CS-537/03]MDB9483765.1 hypothetical protein [Dolichospermum circinale CS-537/05]MDB9488271.1 hypothetical protein [Dolichospermum circinale CS-537/01]
MNDPLITISQLLDTDLETLRKISREIWLTHYPTTISNEQIEYMLDIAILNDT